MPRVRGKILLPMAAIVALVIVGVLQFDQIVASLMVYTGGASLERIVASELPRGLWLPLILNIVLVALFLALIPVRVRGSWKSQGAYLGFMVSMFSEMYGFPLTVYFLSNTGFAYFEPQFVRYVWSYGHLIGSPLVIAGLFLLYLGWKEIFLEKSDKLVTDGIYSRVRHPQYLALILVTLGQLFVWPTIPTAIMWPILTALYYLQAKREEGMLLAGFGKEFTEYAQKTPMFIPRMGLPKGFQNAWK